VFFCGQQLASISDGLGCDFYGGFWFVFYAEGFSLFDWRPINNYDIVFKAIPDELPVGIMNWGDKFAFENACGFEVVEVGVAFVFVGLAHQVTDLNRAGGAVRKSDHLVSPWFFIR
jgi:hypothetical protein